MLGEAAAEPIGRGHPRAYRGWKMSTPQVTNTSDRGRSSQEIRDRWAATVPIEAYVAQLWRKHRARFARNLEQTTVPDDIGDRFRGRSLRLLVLTDPWCEDSAQLVPMVWRLAQEVEGVDLRVLRASEHRDLAGRYLTARGHPAIPVFVVFDSGLRELGALVERPARATAEIAAETRRFQREHANLPGMRRTLERMPNETRGMLEQHIAAWRVEQHDRWTRYLLDDLAAISEGQGRPEGG